MRDTCVPTNDVPAVEDLHDELGNRYTREGLMRRVARAIVRARVQQADSREVGRLTDFVLESTDLLCDWMESAINKHTRVDHTTISDEQVRDLNLWQEWLQKLYDDSVKFLEDALKEPYCPDCESLGNETFAWPHCEKHGRALEWR